MQRLFLTIMFLDQSSARNACHTGNYATKRN